MYLEWPVQQFGSAAGSLALEIESSVQAWADQYGVAYTSKLSRLGYRISFNCPEHFTLFALTWTPCHPASLVQFEVKEPMKLDITR